MVYFALFFLFLATLLETFFIFLFRKVPSYFTHFFTGVACGFLIYNTFHLFITNSNIVFYLIFISFFFLYIIDKISHRLLSTTFSLPFLVTLVDFLHNGLDGSMVTLAFQKDVQTGWEVTFAVFFHEITQELLDILAYFLSGIQMVPALVLNGLASSSLFIAPFFLKGHLERSVLISLLIGALGYLAFHFFKVRISLLPRTSTLQMVGEMVLGICIFWFFEEVVFKFIH